MDRDPPSEPQALLRLAETPTDEDELKQWRKTIQDTEKVCLLLVLVTPTPQLRRPCRRSSTGSAGNDKR
jgi:hypothetical protein